MMKPGIVSGRDICKIIEKLGFAKIHQATQDMFHSDGRKTVVPVHSNEMLGKGLINEILKQTKLPGGEHEGLRLKI